MCVPRTKIYYVIRSGVGSGVRSWRTRFNGQQLRLSWITHGFVYMRENVRPEQLANHKSPEKNYSEIEYFIILFLRFVLVLALRVSFLSFNPKRPDDTGYTIHLFVFTLRYTHSPMFTWVHSQILAVIRTPHTLHQTTTFFSHGVFRMPAWGKHLISGGLLSSSFRSEIGFWNLNSPPISLWKTIITYFRSTALETCRNSRAFPLFSRIFPVPAFLRRLLRVH